MCGRYTLGDPSPLMRRFGLTEFAETRVTPRFNVAPSQLVPIIVDTEHGRELRLARWGFTPPWLEEAKKAPPPINARAETLSERPMFRGALRYQRCLIPADGFYEWKPIPGVKRKQPFFVRLEGGQMFAFAGLYANAPANEDNEPSCAIITTEANELMSQIHDRMPAILSPDEEQAWLDRQENRSQQVVRLLRPYPSDEMEAYPVSTLVNSAGSEGPQLIEPAPEPPSGPAET